MAGLEGADQYFFCRVLDSRAKNPIMKSRTGGFIGDGSGDTGDSMRMLISTGIAKQVPVPDMRDN